MFRAQFPHPSKAYGISSISNGNNNELIDRSTSISAHASSAANHMHISKHANLK